MKRKQQHLNDLSKLEIQNTSMKEMGCFVVCRFEKSNKSRGLIYEIGLLFEYSLNKGKFHFFLRTAIRILFFILIALSVLCLKCLSDFI